MQRQQRESNDLTLSHGLSETHSVHIAMTEFAKMVEERTNGRIQVKIYPNGQLGNETESMEQLMAGVISMTKISAPGLLQHTTRHIIHLVCHTSLTTQKTFTKLWNLMI